MTDKLPKLFSDPSNQFLIKAKDFRSIMVNLESSCVESMIYTVNDDSIQTLFSIEKDPEEKIIKEMLINHSIESGIMYSQAAYVGVDYGSEEEEGS